MRCSGIPSFLGWWGRRCSLPSRIVMPDTEFVDSALFLPTQQRPSTILCAVRAAMQGSKHCACKDLSTTGWLAAEEIDEDRVWVPNAVESWTACAYCRCLRARRHAGGYKLEYVREYVHKEMEFKGWHGTVGCDLHKPEIFPQSC